jgi:hypothetical protein
MKRRFSVAHYRNSAFEKVLGLIAVSAIIGFIALFFYLNSLGFPTTLPK